MSKPNNDYPDINKLIIEKLKAFPDAVSELAIKAVQLSEDLPEATVYELMQGHIRDTARKDGGED